MPRTTHADGAETSWTLHFYPDVVRPGYTRFPNHRHPAFSRLYPLAIERRIRAVAAGFPFDKASANVGKQIVDYKTARIGEAILQVLRAK